MWPDDLENPEAMRNVFDNELGRDIAGNSFTGTVVQAVMIAAMLHTNVLDLLRANVPKRDRKIMSPKDTPKKQHQKWKPYRSSNDGLFTEHSPKRRRLRGKQHGDQENSHGAQEIPGGPSSSFGRGVSHACGSSDIPSVPPSLVTKRLLKGKQPDPAHRLWASSTKTSETKRKKRRPGGNKSAEGKKPSSSIQEKEKLFVEYDTLVSKLGKRGANKEMATRRPKGYYQAGSCVYIYIYIYGRPNVPLR